MDASTARSRTSINIEAACRLGSWASVLTAVFYVAFDAVAISILSRALTSEYWKSVGSYLPSLFLALCFVTMMVCLHRVTPENDRLWTSLALAFGLMYATFNCAVYVIQVLVIAPSLSGGGFEAVSMFEMAPGKALYPVNALAYTLMSVSTFFASYAVRGEGLFRWTRWLLRIHGLTGPAVIGVLVWGPLLFLSATVGITYPIAALLLARVFRKQAGDKLPART